ncbi:MAG: cupredoxin domain-containing protein [Actinomycetota bacterium]
MGKSMIVTAMILGLVTAGCASADPSPGSGGYGGNGASTPGDSVTPAASSTQSGGGRSGYGTGGSASGGGGGPLAGSVVVADYRFTPSNIHVKRGASITIQNSTPQTPHTFTVPGHGLDQALDPQTTVKVTIDLPPGTYPFLCRFHSGLGMKGTLIVD